LFEGLSTMELRNGMIDNMLRDLRFGIRMLGKSPGFTVLAVLSLALGIGANTAIFSLVDAVLIRPLPYHQADRLMMVWGDASSIGFPRNDMSPADYYDVKTRNHLFDGVAAIGWRSFNFTGEGEPEKIYAQAVSEDLFPLLGVNPLLGRAFLPDEDRPGANRVAILSYRLWQRRFGGDPAIIGREILLDDQKTAVIGVMPAHFELLDRYVGMWVPIAFSPSELAQRYNHYLTVMARLKDGVSPAQAQAEIRSISEQIVYEHPDVGLSLFLLSLREQLAGGVRLALLVLLAAVACVLLIACANVANLQLSRSAARHKEIAVRAALGASRWRLVTQLLIESLLISILGGASGLLMAAWSLAFLRHLIPPSMANSTSINIDSRLLFYMCLVSLVTALLFGTVPALQAAQPNVGEALKQAGGRTGFAATNGRFRRALVISEVALSLTLLIGAGLLIKTFANLQSLDAGFRPNNVLTMRTSLPHNKYQEPEKRSAFYHQVLERIAALPAVQHAGYTTSVPLSWKGGTGWFQVEGRTLQEGGDANFRQISPDYFQAIGTRIIEGRFFDDHDSAQSQPVAIINQTMARQFWPDEPALGKRIRAGNFPTRPWVTIVGIVADTLQMGLQKAAKAEMYFPYDQVSNDYYFFAPRDLVISTAGDPRKLAAAAREAIWSVDRQQPVSNIQTMDEIVSEEITDQRLAMILLGALAGLALLLAAVGVYGVLSYTVSQRIQEIGVRMALGARRAAILGMVLGDAMRMVAIGSGLGLAAALVLTRLMSSLLFGVGARDPFTIAVVVALLAMISMTASYIPARRATRIDPLAAIRYE
jgi:putative ABC transport system permease protein